MSENYNGRHFFCLFVIERSPGFAGELYSLHTCLKLKILWMRNAKCYALSSRVSRRLAMRASAKFHASANIRSLGFSPAPPIPS